MKAWMLAWIVGGWMMLHGAAAVRAGDAPRERQLFDFDWRFHPGEVVDGQSPELDDTSWERVDLPHDFMIEGKGQRLELPGDRGRRGGRASNLPTEPEGPFDPRSPGRADNGYLNGGIGWYRKTFTLPETARGRHVGIEFEGVYMNSEVWINGHRLGVRPYGYSSFQYDLTPHLRYGSTPNVLAVRVYVPQPCTRWYSGAGIYRHVWLTTTGPIHIEPWGIVLRTPRIDPNAATLEVVTHVRFERDTSETVVVETIVRDADGNEVVRGWGRPRGERRAQVQAAAGEVVPYTQQLAVRRLRRWSLETPHLYQVESLVKVGGMVGGEIVDRVVTSYGIRSIEFSETDGFLLNGQRVPLRGVCLHHDLGPLGAAAFDRGIERQLEIMKAMGVNAIRTSHNPPAPALLDLCDRMGFVVMDEAFDEWKQNKTRFGYGQFFDEWSERDLRDMVRRDRNHPSVIMWSIGNEIPEQRDPANAEAMASRLAGFVREEDPTRPVTSGMNNILQALETGFARPLDLLGVNYNIPNYPRLVGRGKLYASETSSNYSSRDEYNLILNDRGEVEILHHVYGRPAPIGADGRPIQHCTSYDLDYPSWGNTAEAQFLAMRRTPQIAGEFVWTGFDYIGEPTPFGWPNRSSSFGIVDLCGFPKDRYYLYQSQWTGEPMVHLLPHWNWPDEFLGKAIPVWAYTNADEVELFLNDRSLGTRSWAETTDSLHLAWAVPYERGTLRAVARKGGQVVAEDTVQTTGEPARLELHVDRPVIRADGQDLAFVTVRVVDAQGRLCRTADPSIRFRLTGEGVGRPGGAKIAGIDNGDPTNHEPFIGATPDAHQHLAFNGLCLVVIRAGRAPAALQLTAESAGLAGAQATIRME